MQFIIGLGNPGKKYEKTRHNSGFMVIDALLRELSSDDVSWKMRRNALVAPAQYASQSLLLVKPQTFMNNSGRAVAALAQFYKIKTRDIWVVYDDIDLPLGELRIRESGSSGGHNGAASIIASFGSNDFPRFRLGIGPVPDRIDPADYVLQKFAAEELAVASVMQKTAVAAIMLALAEGMQDAMKKFN